MRPALLALVVLCPVIAAAQQPDPAKTEIKTQRLATSVAELEGAGGNIGVSFGDDGVFLIDDQFAPMNAKIRAAVEMLSKKPLRYVFNTHWHGDHTGGNEAFGAAGVTIVAQDNVRKRLSTDQFSTLMHKTIPASSPKALPVITFNDEMTFFLNGDELRVFHVEHAHTDGDAIIYFKKANVVHMGDTFVTTGYPIIDTGSGGSIEGFLVAADRVLALSNEVTQIIPGHGAVSHRAQLKVWREMLGTIYDRIAKLKAQKRTLEQVKAAKPTAEYDAVWGQWFIKPDALVEAIYQTIGSKTVTKP